jgi:hypothetical protein
MTKCRYEDLIDRYLLDKLKPEEQADFEEHYFICRSCFAKLTERDEIVRILRKEGVLQAPETASAGSVSPHADRPFAFFTPRRWAAVGVSVAAVAAAAWFLIPRAGTPPPPLVLSGDETVRGASLTALAPSGDVAGIPALLEWKAAGENIEYKITLAGKVPLMAASTMETYLTLPESVRARMKAGEKYFWQVQAFKADGTLIAVSGRVRFRVLPR